MSASNQARFEELVSKYIDASLAPEEEAELLIYLEKPAFEEAFFEMTRLNGEIAGVLASPITDETMEALVANDLPVSPRKSSRITAILNSLPEKRIQRSAQIPAHVQNAEPVAETSKLRSLTLPWAISIALHAAAIILFVVTFGLKREPDSTPRFSQVNSETESVARVGSLNGDAYTIESSGKSQVYQATDLAEGQGLETVGHGSMADVTFADGTSVLLDANTRVKHVSGGQVEASQGKRVVLDSGTLRVTAAKQPPGKPMEFVTPNAKAVVVGTRFKLSSTNGATRLEVTEGLVRLARLNDSASIDVKAGEFAIVDAVTQFAARPIPSRPQKKFVKGINFYGDAVTIEGERWLSHVDALKQGLSVEGFLGESKNHITAVAMIPEVDADMRRMLNSRAYSMGKDLKIQQPLQDGDYEVYLWVAEGHASNFRLFDAQIGDSVWRGLGRLNLGEWKKYGPFRTTVKDGKLSIVLKCVIGNPLLCGLSIYSLPPNPAADE